MLHLVDHPLVQHKLTLLRRKEASTKTFRQLVNEIAALVAYEVLRDVPLHDVEIETPLETMTGRVIDGKKLVFVSILRAGTGILDGMLSVVPRRTGGPHRPVPRPPQDTGGGRVLLQDARRPRRARRGGRRPPHAGHRQFGDRRGGPAQGMRPPQVDQVRLPADVPEGVAAMQQAHPDVPIYTAAVDRQLDEHGYILPGARRRR